MTADLRDLYQEVIVDHGRRPRNFGPLPDASHQAEGFNPLCGDRLTLRLKVVAGVIEEARFEGVGCAISTASASLMTEALKGLGASAAEALFAAFHAMLTGETLATPSSLGKLEVLAGVREFPSRIKCATLAWHTLHAALHSENQPVTTE
ncbi:MAG: SUF system NifU family Fe-S cluster assembly protein [Azonexus sp.]|nr:SUF system NifU family Fe-S cluster assembly protein [Azonexus sp.]